MIPLFNLYYTLIEKKTLMWYNLLKITETFSYVGGKMKFIKNIIKRIIALAIIIVLILVGATVYDGYTMYKQAISKVSIEDKVNQLRKNANYTNLDEIPKDYQNAVIAVEDHRFREHGGIDYISTIRAILTNITTGELAEGGSTLTQQLAKNMYFTQEKRFERKVAELFVAWDLEKVYSKDDILEMYINISYYGDGYYGIEKASKGYFNKEPKDMTLYESTLLAGIPNAPSIYALDANPDLAKERQKQVLDSMVKYNYLSSKDEEDLLNK